MTNNIVNILCTKPICSPGGLTLFIQMDYPMHFVTISMELSILYLKVLPVKFYKMMYFCS